MQVYYFSRTGRSEKIAKEISEKYQVDCNKITDNKNWSGAISFVKAGYMSSTKKTIETSFPPPIKGEKIVLVFPIWAGGFPPAVRTFLESVDRSDCILIPTSLGSKLKDRDGFSKVIDLIGKEISTPQID